MFSFGNKACAKSTYARSPEREIELSTAATGVFDPGKKNSSASRIKRLWANAWTACVCNAAASAPAARFCAEQPDKARNKMLKATILMVAFMICNWIWLEQMDKNTESIHTANKRHKKSMR